jgi:protein-S-isoprenylcysteine O-methyltransferase Ste14
MTTAPERAEVTESTARERARLRIERKRKLQGDIAAYFVINAFLIGVWAFTGHGYFWPGWVLGGWGVLLLLDVWNFYYRRPASDEEIEQELRAPH